MNRKKFLTSASVLAIASFPGSSLLSAPFGKTSKPLPIVDTHQHLADTDRFKENWTSPPIPGNYSMRAYLEATKGLNFVKAVYMEVAVPPARRREEALYAIELCKDKSNPTVGAVIAGDLSSPDFENYMAEFKDSPYIKGVRAGFRSTDEMMSEQVLKNVRALGRMNKSLDFSIMPAWYQGINKLIKACPETRFLVNHCGNVDPRAFMDPSKYTGKPEHDRDQWIRDFKEIASSKNVVLKISGIVTRSGGYPLTAENLAPALNQCLDIFGPDRVMFASDWPWCLKSMGIEPWVNILKTVVKNRPYREQKRLFHDNAIKFYTI